MTTIIRGTHLTFSISNKRSMSCEAPLLILNNRDIIQQLPEWFKKSKQTVALITNASAVKHINLKSLAKHFFYVEILEFYETPFIEDAVRKFHHRFGISKLLTISERDITRAAYLRRELNIKGQSIESAIAYRNKFDMKSRAAEKNVCVAKMLTLTDMTSKQDVMEFIEFPMMIKRVDGAAAVDMTLIRNSRELSTFYHNKDSNQNYLAEAFIAGDNYHVDGIMKDGVVVHSWPSRYLYTQWETMYQTLPNISGMLHPDHNLFNPLQSCASRTVESLPPPPGYCCFHAEFFNPYDDKIVLGEIACRPGGAGIVPTYENAFGINLQEITLMGQAQLLDKPIPGQPKALFGWASFPPSRGILRQCPGSCNFDFVKSFANHGIVGKLYNGPRFVTDNIAEIQFLVNEKDPLVTLKQLTEWFRVNCKWEGMPD